MSTKWVHIMKAIPMNKKEFCIFHKKNLKSISFFDTFLSDFDLMNLGSGFALYFLAREHCEIRIHQASSLLRIKIQII